MTRTPVGSNGDAHKVLLQLYLTLAAMDNQSAACLQVVVTCTCNPSPLRRVDFDSGSQGNVKDIMPRRSLFTTTLDLARWVTLPSDPEWHLSSSNTSMHN
ncbi:hypothetical protein L227DRAFT_228766 [Lentinus tigrinus ALCF2SS1-6]|uniref:Uncharacterized protein n=1 Tax=Lentinus tigrinus ALCF2SS1-6 TaxID=1328759 RepID=A0A5C2S1Q5_9APHY|nr:hypothetical protein L227DRAFT_228766 [Lentinus tigrinus ALCF2SS1-6]